MRNARSFSPLPTAVLVDYGDLFHTLRAKLGRSGNPDTVITEALEELLPLLQRQMNAQVLLVHAYADFHAIDAPREVLRDLAARGIRPVVTCECQQRNATELELTMDAAALLARRPELRRVVVVTGQRLYLPLLRRIKEEGRQVVLVSAEALRDGKALLLDEQDRTLSLFELAPNALQPDAATAPAPARRDVEYLAVEDEGALRALEIIEEFFGQYNEVYLTPLLRKLSDELDDETLDPKVLISDLEAAGAVYLEKRRGYPHDYTVLLVDGNHPDVDRIRQMFEDYDEESYAGDDVYDEAADDTYAEDDEALESAA